MSSAPIPVIVTRAAPGAQETAARVAALGATPILSSVLQMVPIDDAVLPAAESLSGLIFTSANGVRAYAARTQTRALTVWCVGPATAAAARQAGFTHVEESAGNAVDLANFISSRTPPAAAPLLHVANAAAKGDLKRALEQQGYAVTFAALYRMQPAETLSPAGLEAIAAEQPAIVMIHSAKGAERFAELCAPLTLHRLETVAISAAASAPLSRLNLPPARIADAPNEDALIETLQQTIATLSA